VSQEADAPAQLPAPAGERSYTMEATPDPESPVVEVSVTVARREAPGSFIVADGAVLSMRRSSISGETVTFIALSVTIARRSYKPSGKSVVSQAALYGAVASVPRAVQEPAFAGEYSNATSRTPAPASLGAAERVIDPRSGLPGSTSPLPGPVASIVHVKEAGVASVFAAASVARTRKV
jgi:hypothetical protein